MLTFFDGKSRLSNVWKDFQRTYGTLTICICCMINIGACFLLNIFVLLYRLEQQVFCKIFLFFSFFSERKDKISSFAFLKISIFHLLYFSRYWNIIRRNPFQPISKIWILPWKKKMHDKKLISLLWNLKSLL